MRVRQLHGPRAGQIEDLPYAVAQACLAQGTVCHPDETPPVKGMRPVQPEEMERRDDGVSEVPQAAAPAPPPAIDQSEAAPETPADSETETGEEEEPRRSSVPAASRRSKRGRRKSS